MQPIGTPEWRKRNRSFCEDAVPLIRRLQREREKPAVVYADPPYTADHYSRYYHVLETLVQYDYPALSGRGLYRDKRFQTPFSLKTKAPDALEHLVLATSQLGADLILSYPTNGIITEADVNITALLRRHYRHVDRRRTIAHKHSTFGASKGKVRHDVLEQIFVART
jgi:adenine-specific DNA-methyltransferase